MLSCSSRYIPTRQRDGDTEYNQFGHICDLEEEKHSRREKRIYGFVYVVTTEDEIPDLVQLGRYS